MRICHINLAKDFRGGERQTELLARELHKLGVVQRAIVRKGGVLAQRLADLPGLDLRPIARPFLLHVGYGRNWLLHAHESKAAHFAHACHLLTGMPYIITRRVDLYPSKSFLTRHMYRKAVAIVAVADAVRQRLIEYEPALDPQVIHSVQACMTSDPIESARIRARWPGKFLVGHIGALVNSQKGQLYIIRAARSLALRCPQLHFVLLGAGRDEAWLRHEAEGLSNLSFAGHVANVGDWLAALDVFILPSLHEGVGSALLDAMSFGLPIVATAVSGIPEIVHEGENGLLVPPADEERLAECILRLYGLPDLRRSMGEYGRQLAGRHTPASMAASYLQLYRGAFDETRSG